MAQTISLRYTIYWLASVDLGVGSHRMCPFDEKIGESSRCPAGKFGQKNLARQLSSTHTRCLINLIKMWRMELARKVCGWIPSALTKDFRRPKLALKIHQQL